MGGIYIAALTKITRENYLTALRALWKRLSTEEIHATQKSMEFIATTIKKKALELEGYDGNCLEGCPLCEIHPHFVNDKCRDSSGNVCPIFHCTSTPYRNWSNSRKKEDAKKFYDWLAKKFNWED